MKINLYLVIIVLSLASGCSSLGQKADLVEIGKVKQIAIVGYTLDTQQNNAGKNILSRILKNSEKNTGYGKIIKNIDQDEVSKKVYIYLKKKLSRSNKWELISQDKLETNPSVIQLYENKNKKIQMGGVFPLKSYFNRREKTSIPQQYYIKGMSSEKKSVMANDLEVNAIITLYGQSVLKQTKIAGFGVGKIKYIAELNVDMYNSNGDLILRLKSKGDEIASSEGGAIGSTSTRKHRILTYKAYISAVDNLDKKLKEKLNQ